MNEGKNSTNKQSVIKRAGNVKSILIAFSIAIGFGFPGANILAQIVNVNCPAQSVQAVLNSAPAAVKSVTLNITGTCNENVLVKLDNVTLRGVAGGTVSGTVTVDGAQRVVFQNMRVTGPGSGIVGTSNAALTVANSIVNNNSGDGILLNEGANGKINNSVIFGNTVNGVYARIGSSATLTGNTVSGNGEYGVFINEGSAARLEGGNSVTSSAPDYFVGAGVAVYRGSSLRIRGTNTITNTAPVFESPGNSGAAGGFALDVEMNSTVRQDGGHTTFVGNIESFNNTTVDLRDADITGGVFVDGLNANVRLRDQQTVAGNITVTGYISIVGDLLSIRGTSSAEVATVNGFIDCNGGFTPNGGDVAFVDGAGNPVPSDFRNCN